ncbi:transglycosylase domain-containing protein [Deinobacterium chartae]|nr:transglycosylase domain-containing protein [Deinobacterium chartae]
MPWPLRSALRTLMALIAAVCAGTLGVLAVFVLKWGRELPDPARLDALTLGATSRILARDGTLLATLRPVLPGGARIQRRLVRLEEVAAHAVLAVVTSEDRRFFEHSGFDPVGIARAALQLARGGRLQGASTLTAQIVKNTLLTDLAGHRSWERKVKEALLGLEVERRYSKQELLTLYLNLAYWGRGSGAEIVGIDAAARAYLGRAPRDLTLAESVYLATLLPAPARYLDYAANRWRMRDLLDRMVADGHIRRAEAQAAWREPLQPRGWQVRYDASGRVRSARRTPGALHTAPVPPVQAPHFVQQVERELVARLGRERVYAVGGLEVWTTLDPQAQRAAEQAAARAPLPIGATLGAVTLDARNGEVLAMVGQRPVAGQVPAEWNNAVQAVRQVGSSIKPLLYTLALEQGYGQDHLELDTPLSLPCGGCPGGSWRPRNYGGRVGNGPVTLRHALDRSLNLPTIRLAQRVGLPRFTAKLAELGLPLPEQPNLTLALGTLETSPLRLAAAYLPYTTGGLRIEPSYLLRVRSGGTTLLEARLDRPPPRRVWSPQVAWLGLDMLRGVVEDLPESRGGLAERARLPGWQVGGKTGTTNDVRDAWFVGLTPRAVSAVWIGKERGGFLPENVYSGVLNVELWRDLMLGTLRGHAPQRFAPPPGVGTRLLGDLEVATLAVGPPRPADHAAPRPIQAAPQALEEAAWITLPLDRRNGRLADEFTPAEQIVRRRVRVRELPLYRTPQSAALSPGGR